MMDVVNIRDYLLKFVGLPYIWGGNNPLIGFDCSGLAIEILVATGNWPHGKDTTAQGLYDHFAKFGRKVPKERAHLTSPPDLVFFGKSPKEVTHIGICLERGLMVEAGGGGRECKTAADAAARNAFVRVRPISYRSDLVAILRP